MTALEFMIANGITLTEISGAKMTREEAVSKVGIGRSVADAREFIFTLERLGLLKFEEEKKPEVQKLASAEKGDGNTPGYNFRLEKWYEDYDCDKYVLWYNGEIVWRSWEKK